MQQTEDKAYKADGVIGADGRLEIIGNYPISDKSYLYEKENPEVVTMYLTVSYGNEGDGTNHTWEEVNTYSAYYYDDLNIERYMVEGLLQVGDENGPTKGSYGYGEITPNATVSIRGQTSTNREQKNYKISIKENKPKYQEQRIINLNKHVGESLRFRNKLCFDLMSEIPGLMSARTQFVHLYVKDLTAGKKEFEDYGLYTQVEQINKTYLKTHGLDKEGQLYKINFFEFFRYEDVIKLKTDPDYDQKVFEQHLEIKGSDDHSKLIAMLEEVNDYSIPIETTFAKWFDEENFFSWMAFHILLGNKDTQSRNTFLYSPLNINKWYFLSWDNDASLLRLENELLGRNDGIGWENGICNYWGNVLFSRVLKSGTYRALLDDKIMELRTYLNRSKIQSMVEEYDRIVYPYVISLPDISFLQTSLGQRARILEALPMELEQNYLEYRESLLKPQPFFIGEPVLTEEGLQLCWDASYSFNNEDVTYSIELSKNSDFSELLYAESDLFALEVTVPIKLKPGSYFVRVKSKNESGYEQYAFDYYPNKYGKVYGTRCFYVLENGGIGVDNYEEQ